MSEIKYNATETWGIDSVQTAATGETFAQLNGQPCDEVTIFNETGQSVDIGCAAVGSEGKFVTISESSGVAIPVAGDAKEIYVRRNDQSNTQITIRYIWRKYKR